jgi:hypothetical protein
MSRAAIAIEAYAASPPFVVADSPKSPGIKRSEGQIDAVILRSGATKDPCISYKRKVLSTAH